VKVYWDKHTLINIDERSVPIEEEELNMKNREREREIGGLVLGRRQK
jgi:6-phosphogluconolactonase/glucosamine-6-phosphate isomerase/deaminase